MVRVVLDGQVIADSAAPVSLEGNYYFPPESVNRQLLEASPTPYVSYLLCLTCDLIMMPCTPADTAAHGRG